MKLTEWIAFGGLVIAIIGVSIEVIKLRRESKNHQNTPKVLMDYISVQKEAITTFKGGLAQKNLTALSELQLQNEQKSWNRVVATARTIGWLYDRGVNFNSSRYFLL